MKQSAQPKFARYQPGRWCRVDRISEHSVIAVCHRRWPASKLYETADIVPEHEQCGGCKSAIPYDVIEISVDATEQVFGAEASEE